MLETSTRSWTETANSGLAGDLGIPCLFRHLGETTEGVDEAQLVFFPFVTVPDWYASYWYREARRPSRAIALLSGIANTLLAASCSPRKRPAQPIASSRVREA